MKVAFSWLKEFVDIDITPQELEEKLFSCGFEVEELIDLSAEISRVVVGKVTSLEKQEGTDHLQLCRLDCGEYGSDIAITTGAPNVFLGALVPVALDNSTIVGGFKIKKRMMQGVESNGMLCSGQELGITDDWYEGAELNGLLILDEDTKVGEDICNVVGLNDYIFDISVTANRPDCQSVLGIAREVAAVLNKPLKMPATDFICTDEVDNSINVSVVDFDLCPRYLAHYVKNIRPASSPRWIKRHLALSGLKSINNVVDITNHTLLEIGQPMHAFDLSKIDGRSIEIRRAYENETIITLDEKEFKLSNNNLVICDASKPVALAGVMGGLNSGISDSSNELLFECATFARDSVRKTSRALGQSSDSSLRYEKGVDEFSTELGLKRALHLIQELNCGDITSTSFDCSSNSSKECKTIVVNPKKINSVLGIEVPTDIMIDILKRLNFEVSVNDDMWTVSIPRYREDIYDYPDLAEEIIRMYGYEHIVPTFLKTASVTTGGLNDYQKQQLKLKKLLCGQGFFEASTLAFYSVADLNALHFPEDAVERNAIRLKNPITEHLSIMRTTLAPSMLNVIVDNLKKGNTSGRLFELSNIYIPKELPLTARPEEKLTLSMGVFGTDEDFYTVKGAIEAIATSFGLELKYERGSISYLHSGITANIICNGKKIGIFGKLANEVTAELKIAKDEKNNQNIYLAEIDFDNLISCAKSDFKYEAISQYPEIKRDLALICDEDTTCGSIVDEIKSANKLVREVNLFDIYRGKNLGENKKSMAFSIVFSDTKEISTDTIDRAIKKILSNLKFKLGIEMR